MRADRVVHCLGDKNQDSCALQHSDLSPPLCALLCGKTACYDWSQSKPVQCCTSPPQLLIHLAFPPRPALVPGKWHHLICRGGDSCGYCFHAIVPAEKGTICCYDSCFALYSLSLTITRILGGFIASGLKLIISARHPKYKRNYVVVFCPGPHRYNDLQREQDFMALVVHLWGLRG